MRKLLQSPEVSLAMTCSKVTEVLFWNAPLMPFKSFSACITTTRVRVSSSVPASRVAFLRTCLQRAKVQYTHQQISSRVPVYLVFVLLSLTPHLGKVFVCICNAPHCGSQSAQVACRIGCMQQCLAIPKWFGHLIDTKHEIFKFKDEVFCVLTLVMLRLCSSLKQLNVALSCALLLVPTILTSS